MRVCVSPCVFVFVFLSVQFERALLCGHPQRPDHCVPAERVQAPPPVHQVLGGQSGVRARVCFVKRDAGLCLCHVHSPMPHSCT